MSIHSRDELIEYLNEGNSVKYVFFWGHQKPESGVSPTCFSQWYDAAFTIDGVQYLTAEHYMMAKKAELFDDASSRDRILNAQTPAEAKKLGRSVHGFDENLWLANRFDIVVQGNKAKFMQNRDLEDFLLSTGKRVLVEASPTDRIWGIGLAAQDLDAENPGKWRGLNLLGFALMQVREQLARM